jgi:aspartyl-tRNA(Asn)/glutamyl-tRNA(Gln) amidotransferase subunit A
LSLRERVARTRAAALGPEVRRRLLVGNYVLREGERSGLLRASWDVRRQLRGEMREALRAVDVLLLPTTFGGAWRQAETERMPPLQLYFSDALALPANLAGLPAVSVPVLGRENGVATVRGAMQIVGRPWADAVVLAAAAGIEGE